MLGELGERGDWRYLIFPVAAVGLIVAVWSGIQLWQRRRRRRGDGPQCRPFGHQGIVLARVQVHGFVRTAVHPEVGLGIAILIGLEWYGQKRGQNA